MMMRRMESEFRQVRNAGELGGRVSGVLRSGRDGDRWQRSALCAGRNESAAVPGHREVRSRRDLLDLSRGTPLEHCQVRVLPLQPLQFAPKVSVLQYAVCSVQWTVDNVTVITDRR